MSRLTTHHDYCKGSPILNENTQLTQLTPIETILHKPYIASDLEKIPHKQAMTNQPKRQHIMWIIFTIDQLSCLGLNFGSVPSRLCHLGLVI